jgi:alpha-1,3-glucosyltransferase
MASSLVQNKSPYSAGVMLWILAIVVRMLMATQPHSGMGNPPMYGDYEAQRHWMEITLWLPVKEWYFQTTENDLQYWGLDYPPLTAFVSWFFGYLAWRCGPVLQMPELQKLVALFASRGIESSSSKMFMRMTVISCDMAILVPVIVWQSCGEALSSRTSKEGGDSKRADKLPQMLYLLLCLLCPSLLLIDHGHFQYNGVCIGLALLAATIYAECEVAETISSDLLVSVLFCLSLNFKQMALYYSPVFFFCLLRRCWDRGRRPNGRTVWTPVLLHFISIASSVIFTFGLLWAPFCYFAQQGECASGLLQVLHRLFPFSRGIFEDKVANLWYALSVAVDVRQFLSTSALVRCSFVATLVLLVPVAMSLLIPTAKNRHIALSAGSGGKNDPLLILLALVNSALAFFLASFQVHEKSLLLALVPAAMLTPYDPLMCTWFQILGTWTMFPLLKKDGLYGAYLACIVGYVRLVWTYSSKMNPTETRYRIQTVKLCIVCLSTIGMLILHVAEAFLLPPVHYPHLFPALFSLYGAANLVVVYVLGVMWQLQASGVVDFAPVWKLLRLTPDAMAASYGPGKKAD